MTDEEAIKVLNEHRPNKPRKTDGRRFQAAIDRVTDTFKMIFGKTHSQIFIDEVGKGFSEQIEKGLKEGSISESSKLYEAIIPLNPRTKKNSQKIIKNKRTGSLMVVQNDRYLQYERDAGWFLKKIPQPISEPVNVKCIFYRKDRTRCDLTNLLEAIDDILVNYGILADDNFNIIVGHDGSRVYVDKNRPRTEIEITKT